MLALIAGVKLASADLQSQIYVGSAAAIMASWGLLLARNAAQVQGWLLCILVLLGMFYGQAAVPPHSDSLSVGASRNSRAVALRGVIASVAIWKPNPNHREQDPSSEPWMTRWVLDVAQVRDRQVWQAVGARCFCATTGRIDDLLPGDEVVVYGQMRAISDATNPGAFDFASHYRQQHVFVSVMADSRKQLTVVGRRSGYGLRRIRAIAVRYVDRVLHQNVSARQAELACALVFGQREQVDWEDQQTLMATGTLHLLAISGLHVEFVALGIYWFCRILRLGNFATFGLLLIGTGGYAALAGGKPPVLRAVVLVAAFSLARVLGRRARLPNVLSLAALVLLLINVAHLDSVGVQLSFIAVSAIGLFSAAYEKRQQDTEQLALAKVVEASVSRLGRLPMLVWRNVAYSVQLSSWVWLMTCPLVWHHFHVVAPVSIPLNVLLAVPLGLSLLGGLLTASLGWIPGLGATVGGLCSWSLALMGWLIELGAQLPGGHLWLPAPPAWWVVVFYAVALGWLVCFRLARLGPLVAILGILVFVGVLATRQDPGLPVGRIFSPAAAARSGDLRCTFLDVGHGTSVVLEFPTGRVWLYDAGHLGLASRSHAQIAAALWELPTARIDTLVISHADIDHYSASAGLVERFAVDRFASTPQFWNSTDVGIENLRSVLTENRVPLESWSAGSSEAAGGVAVEVLHPAAQWRAASDNAASLCLLLRYGGRSLLLPGDLEGVGWSSLVKMPPRPCDVLMAPHHGSLSEDPMPMLNWCQPQYVLISGNHRAARPEVLQAYASTGAKVGVTFRDGALQIRMTETGELTAWHWQDGTWSPLGTAID